MAELCLDQNVMTSATPRSIGASQLPIYPSYRSFDDIVDVERLRSLDSYLKRRIERRAATGNDAYFLNQHRLEKDAPHEPGVREIWLTRTLPGTPYDYMDIDRTALWQFTPEATEFALLTEFVQTLPFEAIGRVLVIYDNGGHAVPAHRDHEHESVCHDFIWMRTNLNKPFYLLNPVAGTKKYIEGYTAWFDTVNQFHGSDAGSGLSFSIRVDGRFNEGLRNMIPYSEANPAATPAIWAAMSGGQR